MRFSVLLASLLLCAQAGAQNYPEKAVTMVVAFPAGGSADLIARAIAEHMTASWKQNVLVVNRAGAEATQFFAVRSPRGRANAREALHPLRPVTLPKAGRPRVRRVTRVVRTIDTWSVFKVALCFSLFFYAVCLTAGVLLWQESYDDDGLSTAAGFTDVTVVPFADRKSVV